MDADQLLVGDVDLAVAIDIAFEGADDDERVEHLADLDQMALCVEETAATAKVVDDAEQTVIDRGLEVEAQGGRDAERGEDALPGRAVLAAGGRAAIEDVLFGDGSEAA